MIQLELKNAGTGAPNSWDPEKLHRKEICLMDVVDTAQINSFAPFAAQTNFSVSPSEEAVFILNSGQLSALITQAIEKAIEPLQDRVKDLKKIVAAQDEQITALTSTQEQDVNRICLDIAYDRQRLARLEKVEPQPLQKDRGEILRALIAVNGGKMLAKDARQKMRLSKELFSMLLSSMGEYIEVKPLHSDRRKRVLYIKGRISSIEPLTNLDLSL